MNIIVCVKRVPFTQEVDLEIAPDKKDIEREDLAYVVNDWDHYAIEAAVRLQEEWGGTVTAVTLGMEEDEEVLRRCLAMGADRAIRIDPGERGLDGAGVARVLARVIDPLPHDLILTGVQAEDDNLGVVGIMLAELLGLNHAAVVTALEAGEGELTIRCELEGGVDERSKIALPALLTVQTGLNEPRYVSIMGIKKAAKKPLEVVFLESLDLQEDDLALQTIVEEVFLPPETGGAEMISGDPARIAEILLSILSEKGVRAS
ncbi:MAG: electron transfer flavoprotein subunit beta/FixA family protein [Deltaproteobacteria bacterium]|nr:electron transfer flavoprotein subunit beta/FixA family protein [Deltaproteobacteria bacterium]